MAKDNLERLVERALFASRWFMAPLYLGLALVLALLVIKFFVDFTHLAQMMATATDVDLVLGALTLVDLVLVASLVVMVMLSGFENFVSKIDLPAAEQKLSWLMKLDTGSIKVKVVASIVAISAIDLLQVFLNIEAVPDDKVMWLVIIHLTFVVTTVLLALLDRFTEKPGGH